MVKLHNQEHGFALVESVLLLLFLLIVGASGYVIWQHEHPSQKTTEKDDVAKLSFQLYAPTILPKNWILYDASAAQPTSIAASSGVINQPSSLDFYAIPSGNITGGLQISEFKLTTLFNPPSDCDGLSQDTNSQGLADDNVVCTLIASEGGQKIYWGTDSTNPITNGTFGMPPPGYAAYTVIGSTLLTIQVAASVSQNTVVSILKSLNPVEASYFYRLTP